ARRHDAHRRFRDLARRGVSGPPGRAGRPDRNAGLLRWRLLSGVLGGTAADSRLRVGAALAPALRVGRARCAGAARGYARHAVDRLPGAHDPRRDARSAVERFHPHRPIQGSILFMSVVFVVVNLVTDLLYAKADPRIAYD